MPVQKKKTESDKIQPLIDGQRIIVDDVAKLFARIEVLEKHLAEYLELQKKRESEQPFIEVVSESFDEKTGLQIKIDWNPAMINYLKRNGYRGLDDDEIIQKYVSDLFNSKVDNEPAAIA